MDPIDVREQRVTTGPPPSPVEGDVTPVATGGASPAAVPGAPTTATSVYRSRVTSPSPVGSRLRQLVWLLVGIVDAILALHFIFRAVGANNTGFAHYIYRLGGALAAPFEGIFNNTVTNGVAVIHWADVLAIVVYTIAAWIVAKLVSILAGPRSSAAA